ncbi:transmembrane protein, putative (macronuclear) [Tetrahymena thermophila SB210]|uniref:Transmembrane protein, putative n=1 Tax=Tetrahymena thermophila (strain SB210) TaxID=312017 RepID=I7MIY5_TETTS|nr:transmembrane protein, putative [Tetrahymena thermophila SB210]EAR95668.1 transmembrane protein, putative [Tetrahymena thermophila SB210]|eukprot:XP_001015913.1 transmembrane protein, putative [Tetrahymena thermophila SB210]
MNNKTALESLPSRQFAGSILDSKMLENSQLDSKGQKKIKRWYLLSKVDLFKYLPVPITNEVSTVVSQASSLVVIAVIVVLFIIQLVTLLVNNQPKYISHEENIDSKAIYDVPEFAFGLYIGDSLQKYFYDDTYFEFQLAQFSQQENSQGVFKAEEIQQQIVNCQPDWISIPVKLNCPTQTLKIQNYRKQNEQVLFPTLKIVECNQQKQTSLGKQCKSKKQVESLFAQGRLLFFIKSQGQYNVITGKFTQDSYLVYQFFINPLYENVGESVLGRKIIMQYPDYLTRFTQNKIEETYLQNFNQYLNSVNNVVYKNDQKRTLNLNSKYDFNSMERKEHTTQFDNQTDRQNQRQLQQTIEFQKQYFLWYLNQDKKVTVIDLSFKTIFDLCSFLGGIWGVLCAVFTILALKRNAQIFYKKKKIWSNFDKLIKTEIIKESLFKDKKSKPSIELQNTPKLTKSNANIQNSRTSSIIYSKNLDDYQNYQIDQTKNIDENQFDLNNQNTSPDQIQKPVYKVQLISINLEDQL